MKNKTIVGRKLLNNGGALAQYRQGDVLIMRVAGMPDGLQREPAEGGRIILAHGEATGHHHSLAADAADWWKDAASGDQFVAVKTPTEVVHQEHARIPLDKGTHRVIRQREYSPEAIRNVAD